MAVLSDELEMIAERLEQTRELVGIVNDEVFENEIGLYPYYKRFGIILECVFDRLTQEIEEIKGVGECRGNI